VFGQVSRQPAFDVLNIVYAGILSHLAMFLIFSGKKPSYLWLCDQTQQLTQFFFDLPNTFFYTPLNLTAALDLDAFQYTQTNGVKKTKILHLYISEIS